MNVILFFVFCFLMEKELGPSVDDMRRHPGDTGAEVRGMTSRGVEPWDHGRGPLGPDGRDPSHSGGPPAPAGEE